MNLDFTDRQLDLMNILWEEDSATVREAKERLDDDLAYTSVLTVFQTLEERGHVEHESEGRAYRYYPTVSREETGRHAVRYLLRRLFRDSPERMVTCLAQLSEEESDPVRRKLAETGEQ